MMNAKKPKPKVSNMMRMMNKMLYTVFGFQLCIIVLFASLSTAWQSSNTDHTYLDIDSPNAGTWFIQLLTFWVAYSHMIPISLYVMIEVLKLLQAKLIFSDVQMYDMQHPKTYQSVCRNSDLIEELGQVEFIFSDKTGTLTQNQMIFKKCWVDGQKFGDPDKNDPKDTLREGICASEHRKITEAFSKGEENMLREFYIFLAVCNTVVVEEGDELRYQASSPDEEALVKASADVGIVLKQQTAHTKILSIDGRDYEYKVHAEFPFDSTRKRMSLVIEEHGQYWVYTKVTSFKN